MRAIAGGGAGLDGAAAGRPETANTGCGCKDVDMSRSLTALAVIAQGRRRP